MPKDREIKMRTRVCYLLYASKREYKRKRYKVLVYEQLKMSLLGAGPLISVLLIIQAVGSTGSFRVIQERPLVCGWDPLFV